MNDIINFAMQPEVIYIGICIVVSYFIGLGLMAHFKNNVIEELEDELSCLELELFIKEITVDAQGRHIVQLNKLLKTAKEDLPERDSKGRFVKKNQVAPSGELFIKKGQIVDKKA